ncbi:MAG: archaeosortase/exosortase family protein [Candidatus Eisenbacteria bacterium]|nr:archaeosortase/exosortase family protein [Candidatus Eisenbacteria bacterium]
MSSEKESRRRALRFAAHFVGLWLLLDVLTSLARPLHDLVNHGLARLMALVLPLVGLPCEARGDTFYFHGTRARLDDPCNGIQLATILVAWVLASRTSWHRRGLAMRWMLPTLAALNLLRLFSLVGLTVFQPALVDVVHLYVWQVGMMGAVMAMAVGWLRREQAGAPRRPRG